MEHPRQLQSENQPIRRRLEMLRPLHPDYSDDELRQAYENLIHYFDMVWRFYERMLNDGTLRVLFDNDSKESYDSKTKVEQHTIK
jgi:hypothetical protein